MVAQPLEDRGCADPAVLVVNRGHASAMSELHTRARHLEPFVLGYGREPLAEPPRRLFPQHSGRLARRVALHDAAFDLEIPSCEGKRGRVQPQRVEVLRPQRGRCLAGDLVERLLRGLRLPVRRSPTLTADPAGPRSCSSHPVERLGQRSDSVQAHIALTQRPGGEVDMRVREPGDDTPPAEVDDLRSRKSRFMRSHTARDSLARDRERTCDGERRVHGADDPVFEDHGRRL